MGISIVNFVINLFGLMILGCMAYALFVYYQSFEADAKGAGCLILFFGLAGFILWMLYQMNNP